MTFSSVPASVRSFFVVLALAHGVHAQTTCMTTNNLVPNGDFSPIGSFANPWQVSTSALYPVSTVANPGVSPSEALEVVSNFTATQPTPMQLAAGVRYEFGCDVHWVNAVAGRGQFYVELLDAAGSRADITASVIPGASGSRTHVAGSFSATTAGAYTIRLVRSVWVGQEVTRCDNVFVTAAPVALTFTDPRVAGSTHTLRVEAAPGSTFAVFFSPGGILPAVVPLPLACSGGWGLGGLAGTLLTAGTNPSGVFTLPLAIPVEAVGLPLGWQPVALPPTCGFGCAKLLVF